MIQLLFYLIHEFMCHGLFGSMPTYLALIRGQQKAEVPSHLDVNKQMEHGIICLFNVCRGSSVSECVCVESEKALS